MSELLRRWTRLGVIAAVTVPAGAQVNQSWAALMGILKPGKRIAVTRMNGSRVEGALASIAEESITVTSPEVRDRGASRAGERRDAGVTVPRGDVFLVRRAAVRQKRALIGLGAGAAAGVVFGSNLGSRRHGLSAAVFGLVFGGIGAAGGAAIPTGPPLYQAPGKPDRE